MPGPLTIDTEHPDWREGWSLANAVISTVPAAVDQLADSAEKGMATAFPGSGSYLYCHGAASAVREYRQEQGS